MNSESLINKLKAISLVENDNETDDGNLQRFRNLNSLLLLEKEILESPNPEVLSLVNTILTTSTPLPIIKAYHGAMYIVKFPSLEDAEIIINTLPLISSPLLKILENDQKENLIQVILWAMEDIFHSSEVKSFTNNRLVSSPTFPPNLPLLGEILKITPTTYFPFSDPNSNLAIIVWSLLNNTSLLQYYNAGDFQTYFQKSAPPSHPKLYQFWSSTKKSYYAIKILVSYLDDHKIDHSLFWDLVKEAPDIPALSVLELLAI